METATKAPQGARPAQKVMEALATLAGLLDRTINEVKYLDKDFQTRLMQAVHDTESSLQAQTAEHVERARQEVQEQLNTKFQGELQSAIDGLKSEFDVERERFNKELLHAVQAASQLESERSGLIAEVQRVKDDSAAAIEKAQAEHVERGRQEVQEQLNTKFQGELQSAIDGLKSEFDVERERFSKELLHAVQAASQLESERSGLIAEVQRVKDDSAAAIEKAQAEHVERGRQEVQEQLNTKFQGELQSALDGLKSEFDVERERFSKELLHAVQAASQLESERSGLIAEVQRVKDDSAAAIEKAQAEHVERGRQEVQEQLNTKFQGELQSAIDGLKSEFDVERERFNKELLHAVQAASQLESERSGLIAEVQRVKDDSAAAIEKAQAEARAAAAKAPSPAAVAAAPPASLQEEMARYEARLQDILKIIEEPSTELSTVIRKNVEKSEVEAYLRGMRFVLNVKD